MDVNSHNVMDNSKQTQRSCIHQRGAEHNIYRILLVSYYCPTRAHAGGLRILDIYRLLKSEFPNTELTLFTHKRSVDWKYDDLDQIFDKIYFSDDENLSYKNFVRISKDQSDYDVVDFQFLQAAYDIKGYRQNCDYILFTPMESLAKSFFSQLKKSKFQDTGDFFRGFMYMMREISCVKKADRVVCVSRSDALFLRKYLKANNIYILETGLSELEFPFLQENSSISQKDRSIEKALIYVAYWGSSTNVEALKWFLQNVHPIIKATVPDYCFEVIGRGDLTDLKSVQDENIQFIGEVETLGPYIEKASVGIAPALFGAGFRGKINQYAAYGVPCVATSISAEGLAYENGESILIEDDPQKFADACVELLTNQIFNKKLGENAQKICLQNYTWKAKCDEISRLYNFKNRGVDTF